MQREEVDKIVSETNEGGGVSRRAFLRSVAIGSGLLIGVSFLDEGAEAATVGEPVGNAGAGVLNAFVRVAPDERVHLMMPAVEMGQGVYTSNCMILAEELDVSLEQVIPEHAPPDEKHYGNPVFIVQATGGSTTTAAWFMPLRKAGAAARAMLLQAAANTWKVDLATLRTANGSVHHDASGRSLSYGRLADRAARVVPPDSPPLKSSKAFTLIGKRTRRLDTPDKVTGKAIYGIDVMLPGMKFATLVSSPVLGGKVVRVDQQRARAIPGVRQIVVLEDVVAVVGDHMWAAKSGLAALHIEWDDGANGLVSQDALWRGLQAASMRPGVVAQRNGDAPAQLGEGTLFEATYELPLLAHASLEPLNCTVHVKDGACEVWLGTQVPGMVQAGVAAALGIDPARVVVNNHLIGGGFGGRLEPGSAVKAARIAQRVASPVKVVWTREEDTRDDYYRPLYHDRLKARFEDGRVVAWHHRVTGPSILARWLPPAFKNGIDADAVDGAIGQPYDFAHVLVEYIRHEPPVRVGFWRGVGPNSNVFSAECFLDLIAFKTGTDPVALRRAMLGKSPRALAVLNLAASKAGWETPVAEVPGARVGRGVALLHAFGSYLACVAEVAVADDGDVRVTRILCAADVGTTINPDTVEAQIQGGAVFGIATILHGQITFANGRVQQSNFNDYRILRIDETPTFEIHLAPSTEPPGGIGEPGTVVVQPAIANAIFAATGVQLARMPVDPSKLAKANGRLHTKV